MALNRSALQVVCGPHKRQRPKMQPAAQDRVHGNAPDSAEAPILHVEAPNAKPVRPRERTSFRRKKNDSDVRQAKEAARHELVAQTAAVKGYVAALKGGADDAAARRHRPSVLLVDGYNVLHRDAAWVELAGRSFEFARAEMEKWIEVYARAARIHAVVVYDAMGSRLRQASRVAASPHVTLLYAATSEADSLIVAQAQRYLSAGAYKVVVVSGDARIRTELLDDQHSFVMLDVGTFVQHLQECRAGDTTGPRHWRSSWAIPLLSPYNSRQAARAYWSPEPGGDTARSADDGQPPETHIQPLEAGLASIVAAAQKRQQGEVSPRLSTYARAVLDAGPKDVALASDKGNDDDDDDDMDALDALLRKKL